MTHTDPLIAEIRLTRQAISAELNHDPKQMYTYYQRIEQELKDTGKYGVKTESIPDSYFNFF